MRDTSGKSHTQGLKLLLSVKWRYCYPRNKRDPPLLQDLTPIQTCGSIAFSRLQDGWVHILNSCHKIQTTRHVSVDIEKLITRSDSERRGTRSKHASCRRVEARPEIPINSDEKDNIRCNQYVFSEALLPSQSLRSGYFFDRSPKEIF